MCGEENCFGLLEKEGRKGERAEARIFISRMMQQLRKSQIRDDNLEDDTYASDVQTEEEEEPVGLEAREVRMREGEGGVEAAPPEEQSWVRRESWGDSRVEGREGVGSGTGGIGERDRANLSAQGTGYREREGARASVSGRGGGTGERDRAKPSAPPTSTTAHASVHELNQQHKARMRADAAREERWRRATTPRGSSGGVDAFPGGARPMSGGGGEAGYASSHGSAAAGGAGHRRVGRQQPRGSMGGVEASVRVGGAAAQEVRHSTTGDAPKVRGRARPADYDPNGDDSSESESSSSATSSGISQKERKRLRRGLKRRKKRSTGSDSQLRVEQLEERLRELEVEELERRVRAAEEQERQKKEWEVLRAERERQAAARQLEEEERHLAALRRAREEARQEEEAAASARAKRELQVAQSEERERARRRRGAAAVEPRRLSLRVPMREEESEEDEEEVRGPRGRHALSDSEEEEPKGRTEPGLGPVRATPGTRRTSRGFGERTPYPKRRSAGMVDQGKVQGTKDVPALASYVDARTGLMDAREWLEDYEAHACCYDWTDHTRLVMITKAVKGHEWARRWHIDQLHQSNLGYMEWREAFQQEFADTPVVKRGAREAWAKLAMLTSETVEQYYARFLKVQRRAANEGRLDMVLENGEASAKFVEGLRPDLAATVGVPNDNDTVQSMRGRASVAESWAKGQRKPSATAASRVGAAKVEVKEEGGERELPAWTEVCNFCPHDRPMHLKRQCPSKPNARSCYLCGEKGHYSGDCTEVKADLLCKSCGLKGHLEKACRKKKAKAKDEKTSQSGQ